MARVSVLLFGAIRVNVGVRVRVRVRVRSPVRCPLLMWLDHLYRAIHSVRPKYRYMYMYVTDNR